MMEKQIDLFYVKAKACYIDYGAPFGIWNSRRWFLLFLWKKIWKRKKNAFIPYSSMKADQGKWIVGKKDVHARNAVTSTSVAVTTTSNPRRETNADDLPLYT
jgi:hypothetical protein